MSQNPWLLVTLARALYGHGKTLVRAALNVTNGDCKSHSTFKDLNLDGFVGELAECLRLFVESEFTLSQKQVFLALALREGLNATRAVRESSQALCFDESTVRKNLQLFKKLNLLSYGNILKNGERMHLTNAGRLVYSKLLEESANGF